MFIMKESDLFSPVASLLTSQGFLVQGEIKHLDVFGVKDTLTIGVELKLKMNLKLIYQAVDRLKVVDLVYIAVPHQAIKTLKSNYRLLLGLLRKLEIGLITIQDSQALVVVEATPFDSVKSHQRNKRKQKGLMKEFLQRVEHPQIGGIKGPRMTAYRLRAMKIKDVMVQGETFTIKQLKALTHIDDVASILRHNYYGWFSHPSRGLYCLCDHEKMS
jgi:hypothetical protein